VTLSALFRLGLWSTETRIWAAVLNRSSTPEHHPPKMYFYIFEGGVFFLRPTVIMEYSMDYFSFPPHIWIIAIPVFLIALLAWIVDNHRIYNRSVAVIRVGFLLAMVFSFAL
jgi:hypothetical protein